MTDLTTITLYKGAHKPPPDNCTNPERCLFEAYNWLTRQRHTDACPPGVSPVLHTYGMNLNDALDDTRRQELTRYLPNGADRLASTAHDGRDETRSYIALDWLTRIYTPAWLDLAGLTAEAASLRELRRVADSVAAKAAGPVLRQAREKSDAAWAAAGAAAWDAAWAAAGAAAGAAARAAAGDAARAAAWDAAWAAAGDAARAAAGDAARAAAGDKLAPTVTDLQMSAIALYDVLISGEWPEEVITVP
jgi:hypothetical protein